MSQQATDTSVGKAAMLLTAFGAMDGAGTLTELALHAGVSKPTAHRLLSLLQGAGLVERRGTAYTLTSMVFQLGSLARGGQLDVIRRAAAPHLGRLQSLNAARVTLCVLDGPEVLVLDQWDFRRPNAGENPSQRRVPVHATASGKALVAYQDAEVVDEVLSDSLQSYTRATITRHDAFRHELARVREAGLALDRQEGKDGLICLALPVRDRGGSVVAAVSLSGPATTFDPRRAEPSLRHCAGAIGRDLSMTTLLAS